ALIARCRESGDVSDDAAAERDEARIAMELGVDELVEDAPEGRERLVLLPVRQDDRASLPIRERAPDALEVERRDDVVRHDRDLPRGHGAAEKLRVVEQAGADIDGVAALSE